MAIFGFKSNKCKEEVYTKEEIEQKLSLQTYNQTLTITDSAGVSGTITIDYYKRVNLCEAKAVITVPYNFARNDIDDGIYSKTTTDEFIADVPVGYIPVVAEAILVDNFKDTNDFATFHLNLLMRPYSENYGGAPISIIVRNQVDQSTWLPADTPEYTGAGKVGAYIVADNK